MPDYPDIPPGVRSFDARRFRRNKRNRDLANEARQAAERLREAEKSKRALADALAESHRKVLEFQARKTIFDRVRLFFARRLGALRNKG